MVIKHTEWLRIKVIIRPIRDGIKIFIKMAVTTLINNTSFHQYHSETIIISTGISSPSSYLIIFSVSFSFSVLTLLYFFPSVILFVFWGPLR